MTERTSDISDLDLEHALRNLGKSVAYPATPDLATSVGRRLEAGRPSTRFWGARHLPRLVSALAVLVLLLVVLVLLPGVREALAERLGLPGNLHQLRASSADRHSDLDATANAAPNADASSRRRPAPSGGAHDACPGAGASLLPTPGTYPG